MPTPQARDARAADRELRQEAREVQEENRERHQCEREDAQANRDAFPTPHPMNFPAHDRIEAEIHELFGIVLPAIANLKALVWVLAAVCTLVSTLMTAYIIKRMEAAIDNRPPVMSAPAQVTANGSGR